MSKLTISDEELHNILNNYKWIKVKRAEIKKINNEKYVSEQHHIEETNFLINKCKELAQCILELKDTRTLSFGLYNDIDKWDNEKLMDQLWNWGYADDPIYKNMNREELLKEIKNILKSKYRDVDHL